MKPMARMARKRLRRWIRRFVAAIAENNRGRWRWTKPMARKQIWDFVAAVADKLLDALVAAVVGEVLNALLKHLLA
jgi:hypothetical protein